MAETHRTDRPAGEDTLLDRARTAMRAAYAPYSHFRVGAAIEAEDGRVFVGCNVENASYPVGVCAERVALGHAVVSGARSFRRLAVATAGDPPASPCGMCRQALSEFGTDLEVISVSEAGGRRSWSLEELLPSGFRASDLGVARPPVGGDA